MFDHLSASVISSTLPAMTYNLPYFGETNLQLIASALIVFLVLNTVFWFLRMVVLLRVKKIADRTVTDFDDVIVDAIRNIRTWVYSIISLYAAMQFFTLPDILSKLADGLFYFAIVWQLIEIATVFVNYFVTRFLEKDEDGDGVVDPNAAMASHMVTMIAKIALWALGGLFVLSNIGVEVTSLIAGLGIGGIAIAFALQGVLGDLFASFSLFFDKPFRIGDFVVIGEDKGTVEKIGIKTTRIKTLQGEELVVSNTELTSTRVQNFKKMQERRISSEFGITYETDHAKVKEISGIVTRIFESLEGARLDRVHFTTFGDSALIFGLVYHVESPDYADYLDIQEQFNFQLMDRFAELGIEFAYPTQTIYTKTVS